MIVMFWTLAAIMVALALLFVLPRLLRGSGPPVDDAAAQARRRLQSLEAAFRDGHLDADDYQAKRALIATELLDSVDEPAAPTRSPAVAAVLLVATPLLAIGLYLNLGNPRALGVSAPAPGEAAATAGESAPELADAMNQLVARLASNPDDVDGWFLLGRTYRTMNRFQDARDAYRRALELAPRTPPIMVELAEALAFSSGQTELPDEARALLEEALALDPNSQKGLWMLGLDAYNAGNFQQAVARWEPLLAQLEPGGGAALQVAEQLNLARERLGQPPVDSATAGATSPDRDAPAPSAGASLTVQIRLSPALHDRVRPGDTLFVFARAHEGPPMPLAIQRLTAGQLPATVQLDSSMAMMPAMSLDKFPRVVVGARISRSGNATAQPGDLQALSPPVSNASREPIELEIATVL